MTVRSHGSGSPVRVTQEYLGLDDSRVGVVYGSAADQGAKLQSALDMAAAAGGGTVLVGGSFTSRQEVVWPDGVVNMLGAGPNAKIVFDEDADDPPLPGDYEGTTSCIRVPPTAAAGLIEGVTITGPGYGGAPVVGTMRANAYGVLLGTRFKMRDCIIRGFGAAVGIINDHQELRSCDLRANGYGLDFMDNADGGLGDQLFERLFLNDQTCASIAISDSNTIANARFAGNGHCGAAPFGVYRYAGQQTPRTQAMQGVVFENWSWEYCGNAMFYDEPGGAAWVNVVLDMPAEFATGGSAKWPGKPWPMAKIHVDYLKDMWFRGGPILPQPDAPDQPAISAKDVKGLRVDDPEPLFDAVTGFEHKSFVRRTGGIGARYVGAQLGVNAGPDGLVLGAMEAAESIARGSLVELADSQVRESRNTTSSQIVGVSLIDYATGDVCVFARSGYRFGLVVRNQSGSTIANGALLVPDGAHQGCVKAAPSAPTTLVETMIVGRANNGAITSGTTGPVCASC